MICSTSVFPHRVHTYSHYLSLISVRVGRIAESMWKNTKCICRMQRVHTHVTICCVALGIFQACIYVDTFFHVSGQSALSGKKIHRHRRPMSQIQATIAMEQKQMRSDMIATAAAGPYTQIVQRISEDLQTRTSQEHPRRIFTQAPTQRIFKILMQGPLEKDANRISTRSSHKDLYEIM